MERLLGLVCEAVFLDTVNEEQSGYGERASLSAGADTKANTMGSGGALQLLEHTVFLDAARDDDGRGKAQTLAREVDLLGRLCALELVDLKRVPVDTAKGRGCGEGQRALTQMRKLPATAATPTASSLLVTRT